MDITGFANLSTSAAALQTADQVGTAVLKKALDIQASNAQSLIESLPPPPSNPPHLGQGVDIKV